MGLKILPSKLQLPVVPAKTLYRARLAERLGDALRSPAVLVAADAGFGKSTLVANFLAKDGRPSIWYRLDRSDSDPSGFAAHLLHGLRPYVPRRTYTAASGGLGHVTDWNVASQLLSITLHRLRNEVVIVLDDYHLLDAPTLQEGMTHLIEMLPARAHLALLTRSRPALPIPRWRAERRLVELGTDDLRFTDTELRELLVGLHGLPLSDASLSVISARTEGWPAGIVLTLHEAIVQGPQAAAQSLSALSGSTGEIYEYLAQEAYARQSPATQRFLLASAVVSQFGVPLLEAMLGGDPGEHRATLDHLERSHLFIVPLDRERRWYRYHHLFQEFLRRIGSDGDREWLRDIHRRAAAWWERHGEVNESMTHLIAGAEFQQAASLLSVNGVDIVARGQVETVRRWLAALPEDTWRVAPRLYYIRGLTEIISGAARQAVRSLQQARRLLGGAGDIEGESMAVRWLVNAAAWEGEIELQTRMLPEIIEMERRLPHSAAVPRANVHAAIGRIMLWLGDLRGAEVHCRRGMEAAVSSGDAYTEIWCGRSLAELLMATGRFRETAHLYEDLIGRARAQHWWHEAAHLHTEYGEALLLIGRDDEADRHLGNARLLQTTVPCLVLKAELAHKSAQAAARKGARDRAEALLRELLGPGDGATPYGLWRFLATVDLSILLAEAEPAESSRLAGEAVAQEGRFGLVRRGQALFAAGLAARSPEPFVRAAATFADTGAAHWQALSLLYAVSFAPVRGHTSSTDPALAALEGLSTEGWEFVLSQAPAVIVSPYRDHPALGSRIPTGRPARPEMLRLTIHCFGPFTVIRGHSALGRTDWPRAAPRRLLQYLLVHDRPVHREEIIEHLWPSAEPRRGANQLRVALAHLRRVLEPGRRARGPSQLLTSLASTVAVARDRLDVDLDRFRRALARASSAEGAAGAEALAEAVALYRGPLFADDPFEEWAQGARARLEHQYLEALSRLAEIDEDDRRYESALGRWLAALETDPSSEPAYRGLIRCYLALGRNADALRMLEACVRSLADLGTVPSAETLALRGRIPTFH